MRRPVYLALLWLLLLQGCGTTMLRSSCDSPHVSNLMAPSSYLVVLPFRYRGTEAAQRDEAGRINGMVALQAIRIAADMDGTHITLVEGDPDQAQCGIESVYERVLDNRAGLFWRRLFHSAVFVWGEFYDAPDGLAVQAHLRTFWNGSRSRELGVNLNLPFLPHPLRFTGELPDTTLSFPTRTLLLPERQAALQAAQHGLDVRTEPNDQAALAQMPRKFIVGRWRNPWLEILDHAGTVVWLRVPEAFGRVDALLPELSFARALTAYMNYRVSGQASDREQVHKALRDFRSQYTDLADPLLTAPLAMAAALEGSLSLAAPGADVDANAAADSLGLAAESQAALTGASALAPHRADLLNLAALTRMPGCCGAGAASDAGKLSEIQRLLEQAYRLDPADRRIARNLMQWYGLMSSLPADRRTLAAAELERRQQALRRALDPASSR